MLYGPAISQSDCRKAYSYQLPCNEALVVKLANGPYSSFHLKTILQTLFLMLSFTSGNLCV